MEMFGVFTPWQLLWVLKRQKERKQVFAEFSLR